MEKKFTKKYYQLGLNHFQVHVSEDMFLQVKLHKDGTYDMSIINPKFTNPKLGKKVTLSYLLKEKAIAKAKSNYLIQAFSTIEEMAKELVKMKK
jgi:hypothetical protein